MFKQNNKTHKKKMATLKFLVGKKWVPHRLKLILKLKNLSLKQLRQLN